MKTTKKKSAKKKGAKAASTAPATLVRAAEGFQGNDNATLPRGFNWRAYDAYLFDIDGTLLNARDSVHFESFLGAMRDLFQREISLEGVTVHGSTDPLILLEALEKAGIPEAEGRAALAEAMEKMCSTVESRAADLRPELCGGMIQLLDYLKSQGKLLGVTSGNITRIGWAKLKAAGIDHYFSFGSFSDQNETREGIFRHGAEVARQHLGPQATVCFLGDTPADVAAARAAGFPVIALATGIYTLLELAQAEPNLCIPGCESLWRYK